jgi:hypothetical protein
VPLVLIGIYSRRGLNLKSKLRTVMKMKSGILHAGQMLFVVFVARNPILGKSGTSQLGSRVPRGGGFAKHLFAC